MKVDRHHRRSSTKKHDTHSRRFGAVNQVLRQVSEKGLVPSLEAKQSISLKHHLKPDRSEGNCGIHRGFHPFSDSLLRTAPKVVPNVASVISSKDSHRIQLASSSVYRSTRYDDQVGRGQSCESMVRATCRRRVNGWGGSKIKIGL